MSMMLCATFLTVFAAAVWTWPFHHALPLVPRLYHQRVGLMSFLNFADSCLILFRSLARSAFLSSESVHKADYLNQSQGQRSNGKPIDRCIVKRCRRRYSCGIFSMVKK
ncbi:hypothetical protein NPIL_654461, partial [Nephila pilipes]